MVHQVAFSSITVCYCHEHLLKEYAQRIFLAKNMHFPYPFYFVQMEAQEDKTNFLNVSEMED